MTNVLVTGGAGNIGMYAVAEFISRGHKVVALDRNIGSPLFESVAPTAQAIQADILDVDTLSEIVRANDIDYILHLAAFLGVESVIDPIKTLDVNCRGTANIFDVALRYGVKRVCWTSSIAALGTMDDYDGRLVDENYRVAPITPYGASKYYCELMGDIYQKKGLDLVCVRPAFAFGLGKLSGSWGANYNRVIYNVAVGSPCSFPAWSKNGLQIIYNKDQAKLCVEATLADNCAGKLFNTPTEGPFSEGEFVSIIRTVVPDAEISIDTEAPVGSAFPPNVDGGRAIRELGFKPDYSVKAGIEEMVDYYRRNPVQNP